MRESNILKSKRRQVRRQDMVRGAKNIGILILAITLIISVCSGIEKEIQIQDLNSKVAEKEAMIKKLNLELDAANIKIKQLDDANKIIAMNVSRGVERDENVKALKTYIERLTGKEVLRIEKRVFQVTKFTEAECGKSPSDPNYGRMNSGKMVYDGAVAAPKSIPKNAAVLLNWDGPEGNKIYTVEDTGGAIVDGAETCIDIYTKDRNTALDWGRKHGISGYVIVFKNN